jgi:guanidinoacetate N-methyltransferase
MDWISATPIYDSQGLWIGGQSIVENWEEPIQEVLAKSVFYSLEDKILEIGYGLGFASQTVAKHNPLYHTVIEAHPSIAKKAKTELPATTLIIEAFWQEAIKQFEDNIFDGLIFDAYTLSDVHFDGTLESNFNYAKPILHAAKRILRIGGKLSFLDFSCQIDTIKEFQEIVTTNYSKYEIIKVEIKIPESCTYASGTYANVIVITK